MKAMLRKSQLKEATSQNQSPDKDDNSCLQPECLGSDSGLALWVDLGVVNRMTSHAPLIQKKKKKKHVYMVTQSYP